MKNITIAIDGWSSCGKSTLAKALAKKLNYIYVDTGAMYRGVALHALRKDYLKDGDVNTDSLLKDLAQIKLSFINNKNNSAELILNGENVESEIRKMEVSNVVSIVAAIKEVREALVEQQREMGKTGGVVMDGRDIGSVVFPNAELKLFVTADPEIRAKRRYDELISKGQEISLKEVRENLENRDHMDTNRTESPLVQTPDAIVVDNSNMNQEEQLTHVLNLVKKLVR